MRFYSKNIISISCLFLSFALPNVQAKLTTDVKMEDFESFEKASLPEYFSVKNGKLTLSNDKYVDGQKALKWDWQQNSTVNIQREINSVGCVKIPNIAMKSEETFAIWIYSPQKNSDAKLNFAFFNQGKKRCNFDVNVDFKGWRTIWVAYSRDMGMEGKQSFDNIQITAPDNVKSGIFYFDAIFYNIKNDIRHNTPDLQIPFIRGGKTIGHGEPQLALFEFSKKFDQEHADTARILSDKDIDTIAKRVENISVMRDITDAKMNTILNDYKKYNIVDDNGDVKAKFLLTNSQLRESFYKLEDEKYKNIVNHDSLARFEDFTGLMLNIAQTYRSSKDTPVNSEKRELLREMFMTMARVLIDQGWVYGSSNGTTHHFGYSARRYYGAMFLMRKELAEAGLSADISGGLIYYLNADNILNLDKVNIDITMDILNTELPSVLQAFLSMDDGIKKESRIIGVKKYLETLLQHTPERENGFKSDGTFFHHNMHYAGYGLPALNGAIGIAAKLHNTPAEISIESYDALKYTLLRTSIWASPAYGFMAFGRHPLMGNLSAHVKLYQNLAVIQPSSRMANSKYDAELMQEYARLLKLYTNKEFSFNGEKITPAENPQGAYAFNYAASGVLRSGDSTVVMKGYAPDVKPNEIYGTDNRYGRYQSHGTMQIFKKNAFEYGGHMYNGWDWSRPAGATTLQLTPDELEGDKNAFYGKSPAQKAEFGGAATLDSKFGLFAFKLLTTDKDEQSLQFFKSTIFYKNILISLGSNISNGSKKYHTQTVLFQNAMSDTANPISVNSKEIREFPYQNSFATKELLQLTDLYSHTYFVVGESDDIKVQRSHQLSKHDKKRTQTEGDFAVAYIDHGTNPQNSAYEYVVLLDAKPKNIADFSNALAPKNQLYKVIQKNDQAHIVELLQENVTTYAIFRKKVAFSTGIIKSIDNQCLVIVKKNSETEYTFSVCNPVITSNQNPITITLNGNWQVDKTNKELKVKASNNITELSVNSQQGESIEFTLKQK